MKLIKVFEEAAVIEFELNLEASVLSRLGYRFASVESPLLYYLISFPRESAFCIF